MLLAGPEVLPYNPRIFYGLYLASLTALIGCSLWHILTTAPLRLSASPLLAYVVCNNNASDATRPAVDAQITPKPLLFSIAIFNFSFNFFLEEYSGSKRRPKHVRLVGTRCRIPVSTIPEGLRD